MAELDKTSLINDGNLLAYYKFNNGALTTDSSGNSKTITDHNGVVAYAGGKYGYCADYGAGNSGNRYYERAEDIWNNGAFSSSFWVKMSTTERTGGVFSAIDATTDKQHGAQFYWDTVNLYFRGRIYRVGVGYDNVQSVITSKIDTNWHHYATTLTTGAGGTLKIYMDGVELNSGSVTNASGTTGQVDAIEIGRFDGQYVEQYMDEMAFFSDVLTPAEINLLAKERTGGPMFFSGGGLTLG